MPEIDGLSVLMITVAYLIILFAGLVHGTLGLGFPLVATPLLALFMDVRSAILVTLLPTMAVNVVSILQGGRWGESIGRHWLLATLIPIGTAAGTQLLISVDPAPFKLLLAVVILFYLNLRRFREGCFGWVKHHRAVSYVVFGLGAGLLSGTVNVMVPLLIIFALEFRLGTTAMVQVFNFCFLIGKMSQFVVFAVLGRLSVDIVLVTGPLAAAGVVTLLAGMAVRARADAQTYRRWLQQALFVVALVLIGQFFVEAGLPGSMGFR